MAGAALHSYWACCMSHWEWQMVPVRKHVLFAVSRPSSTGCFDSDLLVVFVGSGTFGWADLCQNIGCFDSGTRFWFAETDSERTLLGYIDCFDGLHFGSLPRNNA
jgi:hypothetical protein